MATLDSLQAQLNTLESTVSGLSSSVSSQGTSIHNLEGNVQNLLTRMAAAESTLQQHRAELDQHRIELNDHERRLKLIEEEDFKFSVVPYYKYPMKYPKADSATGNVFVYLPPFTKDELKEYNPSVPGLVDYKWYQKVFNPVAQNGSVTFDFDNSKNYLKSISLGPSSQISIPIPLHFINERPNRKLVMQSARPELVCTTQFLEYDKENVITLYNFTNSTINIQTGEPLLFLTSVYGYKVKETEQTLF